MHHITKPITSLTIIAALITPTFSTNQDYTYEDIGLSHKLKIYNDITIDYNKIDAICNDMREFKAFLKEREQRDFCPYNIKHRLFMTGYLRKLGIHNVPQELILLINDHIPTPYIQQPTYFFLPKPIKKKIDTILNTCLQAKENTDSHNINDDNSDDEDSFVIYLKNGYSTCLTLKEFFSQYDPVSKDYKKGFDHEFRKDVMKQYKTEKNQKLAKADYMKEYLRIRFVSLHESTKDETDLLYFHKYSSTFNDIIDVINFANGAKPHNHSDIEQYYSTKSLEVLKGVPQQFNKNWTRLPYDIYFYNKTYLLSPKNIDSRYKFKLLDPNKPIVWNMKAYVSSHLIYFSTIPLMNNVLGLSN